MSIFAIVSIVTTMVASMVALPGSFEGAPVRQSQVAVFPTTVATQAPMEVDTFATIPSALAANVETPATSGTVVAPAVTNGKTYIDVNLTKQYMKCYKNGKIIIQSLVSTGTYLHPTVTGTYKIYARFRYKAMRGPGYYLPNVPYTQFFYRGYGLHGTYWHHNFGHRMSHGCVNLPTPIAKLVYDNYGIGTNVVIHY